jgi:hypothetical protein
MIDLTREAVERLEAERLNPQPKQSTRLDYLDELIHVLACAMGVRQR